MQSFKVENMGLRTVKVSWQEPVNPNGEIISYTLDYRKEEDVSKTILNMVTLNMQYSRNVKIIYKFGC